MRYEYIAVYEVKGLIHNPDAHDVEVYTADDGYSVKAILTDRLDEYCSRLDCAHALGNLLLRGLVGGQVSDDLAMELESQIRRIREPRSKIIGRSEVLVFTAEGEVEPDLSAPRTETDGFVFGFRLVDKQKIVNAHSAQLNGVLAALCLSAEHDTIQIRRIQKDVYMVNECGKPVYSFDLSASASAFLSKRTTDKVISEVQRRAAALTGAESVAKVNRLLVQAISSENDNLRRFIFGWSALEIFINKVFPEYEQTLFAYVLPETRPVGYMDKTLKRIRDVMRDKYRITEKFNVVAACLGNDSVETDLQTFTSIKNKRDALLHGEAVDEDSLPVTETTRLLEKYLRLHIVGKAA